MSKVLKGFMLGLLVFMLSACGGGSSTAPDANNTTALTAQALAIQAIATYAQDGGTAPSVEVYATAGVSGIDATNLDAANTLVESLVYEDVDTVEEIQALVDRLNANTAPVATAQTLTTAEDTAKTFTLSGTDVEGDTLTYTIKTPPSHGTISGNTYTPNQDYFGADSFSFVVNDGTVDSAEATVIITITSVFDPFITTWKTDNEGNTTDTQIKIGTYSGSTYNFTVEWGDGSKDENVTQSIVHDYGTAGTYTVKISGEYPHPFSGNYTSGVDNYKNFDAPKLLSVEQWGDIEWKSMAYAFLGASKMVGRASDVPDLSAVTNMSGMFRGTRAFNQDLSAWNVSAVTNMSDMFAGATAFNQVLSTWDVSAVTDMSDMFAEASTFNQDLSAWNVSAVTNMGYMFYGASAFNQVLSTWNVSAVTNMRNMFSRVNHMGYNPATGSFNQDLSTWDVSAVTNMSGMFRGTRAFNQDLSAWNVSAVTNMSDMFYGATAFNQVLSTWDVSAVTDMSDMFAEASTFNQDLSAWNVSAVTDMGYMFYGATAFNQDLSDWDVSSVRVTGSNNWKKGMYKMFDGVTLSTPNYDALLQSWSAQNLQSGITFNGGNSQYSSTSQAARDTLTNDFNWTVTDGGVVP